ATPSSPPFPTRRSSDLFAGPATGKPHEFTLVARSLEPLTTGKTATSLPPSCRARRLAPTGQLTAQTLPTRRALTDPLNTCLTCRSEEHTSELQSRENLV